MTERFSRICGVGSYLPKRIMTNEEMSALVDTSDEWIQARTGIKQRHIAADDELTSDIGVAAAQLAMERAGVSADDIDLIVVATTTPDRTFPACASAVQAKLGVDQGAAFDIQAVCSGFVFALSTVDKFLKSGEFSTALVIGAETFSRLLDWNDRSTCVLFGDGGGAAVVKAEEAASYDSSMSGIIGHHIRTDGGKSELLYVDGGPSSTQTIGHVRMDGPRVFKHAVTNISSAIEAVFEDAGVGAEDIDWFVPHQANQRILDGVAKKLGIDGSKVVSTVSQHGNTSAASIPLALDTAIQDGRIKTGQLVLIEAMGGGFTWGASLFRM
ncbi:MAG: beta-ketoacyl-ACP synthase III [Pseudomonadota bacterium]